MAASSIAREVIVKADIANTAAIRIGPNPLGAGGGVPLNPGELLKFRYSGRLDAYAPAAGQLVSVIRTRGTPP